MLFKMKMKKIKAHTLIDIETLILSFVLSVFIKKYRFFVINLAKLKRLKFINDNFILVIIYYAQVYFRLNKYYSSLSQK